LNAIETLAEVSWLDSHLGKDRGDQKTGVRPVETFTEDVDKPKNFLRSLASSIWDES